MTQAWRPRQTRSPTGRPVWRMAEAARCIASSIVFSPTSRYGPAPSWFRPADQPRTLAPLRSLPSPRLPLSSRARFWRRSCVLDGPVVLRVDHVEHHLHARADALHEVRLGDVVTLRAEVELEARVRRLRPGPHRTPRPAARAARRGGCERRCERGARSSPADSTEVVQKRHVSGSPTPVTPDVPLRILAGAPGARRIGRGRRRGDGPRSRASLELVGGCRPERADVEAEPGPALRERLAAQRPRRGSAGRGRRGPRSRTSRSRRRPAR